MKLKKRSTGEYFTLKEFLKQWKEGLRNITPLQQCKSNQFGYLIVFVGIIWGMTMCIKIKQWWLLVILTGSFIITGNSFHANWIRKDLLNRMENELKHKKKLNKLNISLLLIWTTCMLGAYWYNSTGFVLGSLFTMIVFTMIMLNKKKDKINENKQDEGNNKVSNS